MSCPFRRVVSGNTSVTKRLVMQVPRAQGSSVCVCVCAVIKFFERTIPECQAGEHAIKRETFRFGAQRTLVIKRIRAVIGGPALFLALLARPWAGLFRLSFSFFLIMSPRRRQIGTLCAVFSDGSRRPREAHANFC